MTGLAGSRSSSRLDQGGLTARHGRRPVGPSQGPFVGASGSAIPLPQRGRTGLAGLPIQILAEALARWDPFGYGTDPLDYCEFPAQDGSGVEVWFLCLECGTGRNPTRPGPARILSSVAWACVECGAEGTRDRLERRVRDDPRTLDRLRALLEAGDP